MSNDPANTPPEHDLSTGLSEGVVRKVAMLSRLALDDEHIASFTTELGSLLSYIERLREIDVEGVEPMSHPLDVTNRMDKDIPGPMLPMQTLMDMASETHEPFVKAPKVLGDGSSA